MESFKAYLEESTINTEKVKTGIIHFINDSLLASAANSATIVIGKHRIQNVVAAKPSTHRSTGGIIPYSDVELVLTNGSKINVGLRVAKSKKFLVYRGRSLRGAAVPALFTGIHSLDKMFPEAREYYVSSILDYYRTKGYEHGSNVPTVYGKIDGEMKEKILLGDSKHGGKIDFLLAIDRAPLTFKKMRIPSMRAGYKGNEYVITIKDSRAFSASEIMANNDVYMWAAKRNDRLYMGNDKFDENNLPAIFGPPMGSEKDYGIRKYRVGVNVDTKDSIPLADNTRVFRLELKAPQDLEGTAHNIAKKSAELPDETPSQDRGYRAGTAGGRSSVDAQKDKVEYGETLSPDGREKIIDTIADLAVRGIRHRYKEDLDRQQVDNIKAELEDLDDDDLKRMASTQSHRLATEIKSNYL
jgi:hypothetical protein